MYFEPFSADHQVAKQMEILSQRWHHEHAGQGLRVPEIEWRRRVVMDGSWASSGGSVNIYINKRHQAKASSNAPSALDDNG